LQSKEIAKVQGKAKDAENLETRVKNEWMAKWHKIAENQIPLKADNVDEIWTVLKKYLSKSFYRHGVQTSQLFLPDFKPEEDISLSLAKLLQKSIDESETTIPDDFIKAAVSDFLKNPSSDRINYLSQLLDSTFSFFAINLDDAVSNFLSSSFKPLKIFLDTNFIFGILGLHNHPLVDVSNELVHCIGEHFNQIKLYYHAATVEEMQRTVNTLSDRLVNKKWNYNLSKAGLNSDQLSGLELHFHQENVNRNGTLDPKVYIEKYTNPIPLLKDKGFVIFNEKTTPSLEIKSSLIAEYKEFVESRRKPKPYKAYDHDMIVLLATERNRSANKNSVLDAGAFFLTCDYHLYAFDKYCRSENQLNSVVLPNHLLQVLRPLIPKSEDFDKRFVATFAIPEFRTIGSDYSETISKVMSYLATFKDIREETASRILGDRILMNSLQGVNENSEEFAQSLENALAKHNEELIEEISAIKQVYKNSIKQKNQIKDQLDTQKKTLDESYNVIANKEDALKEKEREIERLRQEVDEVKKKSAEDIENEKKKCNLEIDASKENLSSIEKHKFLWRLSAAFSFSLILTLFFFFNNTVQSFIKNSQNYQNITILTMMIVWGVFIAISFEKHRKWTLGTIILASLIAIITII
jgi:hypothetical protein